MLSAILADPTALPLWMVALFAAAMYPLGLLLPGCPCCATGCTQCGILGASYGSGQKVYGWMCCDGTLAPSITVRLTSVGPAVSNQVTLGAPVYNGALGIWQYPKYTVQCGCTAVDGDYVLPLARQVFGLEAECSWVYQRLTGCGNPMWLQVRPTGTCGQDINAPPAAQFPAYALELKYGELMMSCNVRAQTCTESGGVESCNVGGTYNGDDHLVYFARHPLIDGAPTMCAAKSAPACNPAGTVFSGSAPAYLLMRCVSRVSWEPNKPDTGCRYRVELV